MQPTTPTLAELKQFLLERLNLDSGAEQDFLEPRYQLDDPFLFRDMDRAVERIHMAIQQHEHIGIYSDYDCDGIPGAVVLVDFFKILSIAELIHVYIPDRHDEGYGVNMKGIDELHGLGVAVMVTVDVGITALAEVSAAQAKGIDVIVTDHHSALEILPDAYAVVHPAVGDYPEKNLCGAAVAFMLVRAFLLRYGKHYSVPEGWEKWLLDLVGFATLSDMVPLTGENRILAWYGMMVMRKTRRFGLQALFSANSIDSSRLTENDLTFTVAPRLNAASRMATPALAFELLATEDRTRAMELVRELTKINDERKLLVARIAKEAHARLAARPSDPGLPEIVVIGDLSWRPAVLGLVAGKLQETYGKSFFVWGEGGDGTLKGSCRMMPLHHASLLMQALPKDILLHSGGHQAAGGFAATKDQIHFLEKELNAALAAISARKVLADGAAAEMGSFEKNMSPFPLPLSCASVRHLQIVRSFAPFGVGNPEPIFRFDNIMVESSKKFGKAKEHIELVVSDTSTAYSTGSGEATAFTFFVDDAFCQRCTPGTTLSLLGTLEAGWRGGIRIRIKEIL